MIERIKYKINLTRATSVGYQKSAGVPNQVSGQIMPARMMSQIQKDKSVPLHFSTRSSTFSEASSRNTTDTPNWVKLMEKDTTYLQSQGTITS